LHNYTASHHLAAVNSDETIGRLSKTGNCRKTVSSLSWS